MRQSLQCSLASACSAGLVHWLLLEHKLEQHMNRLNLSEMTSLERLISGDIKFV